MRNVFTSSEVPHLWAHCQSTGRKSARSGNLFFDCDRFDIPVLYSYGYHYRLAALHTADGQTVATINSQSRSVTTSKHASWARQAVNGVAARVYIVPDVLAREHTRNLAHIRNCAIEAFKKMKTARNNAGFHAARLEDGVSDFNGYKRDFCPQSTESIHTPWNDKAETCVPLNWQLECNRARERAEIARLPRAAREIKAAQKTRADFTQQLAEWKAGNRHNCPQCTTIHLRLHGADTIQTSRGASFPLVDGLKVWQLIRAAIDCKRAENPPAIYSDIDCHVINGSEVMPLKLGEYAVNKIDNEGNVTAGCHFVGYPAIEDFARRMKWIEKINVNGEEIEVTRVRTNGWNRLACSPCRSDWFIDVRNTGWVHMDENGIPLTEREALDYFTQVLMGE